MGDDIIETNVLLVASGRCDHVSAEQQQEVLKWLMDFRNDGQRKIVLDQSFKIWNEYHNQMTRGQDIGSLAVAEKLQFARFVDISYDNHGDGLLPPDLEKVIHDRSDRKFVAVALIDRSQGGESTITNAVDSDWSVWEENLTRAGVTVRHLLEELCRDWQRKRERGKRKRTRR